MEVWRAKNMVFLPSHVLYLFIVMRYSYTAQVRPWADTDAKPCRGARAMQSTENLRIIFMKIVQGFRT